MLGLRRGASALVLQHVRNKHVTVSGPPSRRIVARSERRACARSRPAPCPWPVAAERETNALPPSLPQVNVTSKGVAVVKMDVIGAKQNTLSEEFNVDIEAMIKKMEADSSVKAVVVMSGKPGSWIAGADIKMIEACESVEEAVGKSAQGQKIMDQVAAMQKKKPWIAAIDGACLGGGLETAMAMSMRIATSSSKTQLGVPEVMLGLLPGAGGTQRLPKIVGAANALDLMLTGKMLKAEKAKKMGLVDLVVDPSALERTAIAVAEEMIAGTYKPKKRTLGWMDWFLEQTSVGRNLMFKQVRARWDDDASDCI